MRVLPQRLLIWQARFCRAGIPGCDHHGKMIDDPASYPRRLILFFIDSFLFSSFPLPLMVVPLLLTSADLRYIYIPFVLLALNVPLIKII